MTREEAIRKVRCELSGLPFDKDVREAFETLIPELKESEDEKIRKYLIDELRAAKSVGELKFTIPQPTREECIAYLEKQKGQIPYTDFVIKPHKGDDTNPYDMSASEAEEYAVKRGFGIPFNDGEVYVDGRHITQTIGNVLRWADEHPKEQKPEVKAGDGETEAQEERDERSFILDLLEEQLRYCKKNQEGARRSRRIRSAMDWAESAAGKCGETVRSREDEKVRKWLLGYFYLNSDVLRGASVTLGEVLSFLENHPGKGKEDMEEFEFNPKPGEKFWVRCKTNKTENLWFDKDDERPAYVVTDPSGIITYIVHIKKDGTGNCVSYQNKEKFLETFDIVDGMMAEQWPKMSNCKRDCRTCFARCIYRKEQNPEQ